MIGGLAVVEFVTAFVVVVGALFCVFVVNENGCVVLTNGCSLVVTGVVAVRDVKVYQGKSDLGFVVNDATVGLFEVVELHVQAVVGFFVVVVVLGLNVVVVGGL